MTERQSWKAVKRERKVSIARRAGYRRAKEAFEIASGFGKHANVEA